MEEEEEDLSKVKEITEDAPIVRYVNLLITQAIQDRASDIHIEPTENDLRVRYRIDGVLHEVHARRRKTIQPASSRRLKIMADINIAERRIPQDGRHLGQRAAARASTSASRPCPPCGARRSSCGSSTTRRRRPRPARPRLQPDATTTHLRAVATRKPYGMILVTGPTGSGKSTTLYATLNVGQHARGQHHHRRGPGRVPPAGHQPGAGQPEGRPDVRRRRCARSCGPTPTSS